MAASNTNRPRRPWLRYSLRGLLIVMTGVCIWLAYVFNQVRHERRAVQAVVDSGGLVVFDYHFQKNSKDAEPPGPAWLRRLIGDELFRTPQHVHLSGQQITDEFLAEHAPGLRGVEFLSIDSSRVTDVGLSNIAKLPSIDMLSVDCSLVTDAGVAELAQLTRLQTLGLDCPQVTDESMRHVAQLSRLTTLRLVCPLITADGVRLLSPLTNLRTVACLRDAGNQELAVRRHSRGDVELIDVPVVDALEFVAEAYDVNIKADGALQGRKMKMVTAVAKNQTLDATLNDILAPDLGYYIANEVIRIAPHETAEAHRAGERAFQTTLPKLERLWIDW